MQAKKLALKAGLSISGPVHVRTRKEMVRIPVRAANPESNRSAIAFTVRAGGFENVPQENALQGKQCEIQRANATRRLDKYCLSTGRDIVLGKAGSQQRRSDSQHQNARKKSIRTVALPARNI